SRRRRTRPRRLRPRRMQATPWDGPPSGRAGGQAARPAGDTLHRRGRGRRRPGADGAPTVNDPLSTHAELSRNAYLCRLTEDVVRYVPEPLPMDSDDPALSPGEARRRWLLRYAKDNEYGVASSWAGLWVRLGGALNAYKLSDRLDAIKPESAEEVRALDWL